MRYGQLMTRLISLRDAPATEVSVVGAKAASLARLHRERVPVMPGVVIPAGALHDHLREQGWLQRASAADESLADEIASSTLNPELADEIRQELEDLGKDWLYGQAP